MENSPLLWTLVALPVVANLIQVGVLYLFKVPGDLQKLKESSDRKEQALEKQNHTLELILDRLDVMESRKIVGQKIFSDMLGQPIDIDAIARDWSKYPRIERVVFHSELASILKKRRDNDGD